MKNTPRFSRSWSGHVIAFGMVCLMVGSSSAQDSFVRSLLISESAKTVSQFEELDSADIAYDLPIDAGTQCGAATHGSGIIVSKPVNRQMRILLSDYASTGFVNHNFYLNSSDLYVYHLQQYSHMDSQANFTDSCLICEQRIVMYQDRLVDSSYWTKAGSAPFLMPRQNQSDVAESYRRLKCLVEANCDSCYRAVYQEVMEYNQFHTKVESQLPEYEIDPKTDAPQFPLQDGEYEFMLRFAEHPNIVGVWLSVTIKGDSVFIDEKDEKSSLSSRFKLRGRIVWHKKSKSWVIIQSPEDENAEEVGGCSDGPLVIDPRFFHVWTC